MAVYLHQIFPGQYQVQQHLRDVTGRMPGPVLEPQLRMPDPIRLNDMQRLSIYNPNIPARNLERKEQFFKR